MRNLKLLAHAASLALSAGLLGSCSLMPGSGPYAGAVVEKGAWDADHPEPQFALVDITDSVVETLARVGGPSFLARFGDYRQPVSPVIGAGDVLQITVWEAAAGGLFSATAVDAAGASAGSRSVAIPEQAVSRDGDISIPYVGRLRAAGRTTAQVEAAIVERLRGKAIEPQALVNISRNASHTVTVNGEVTNGARVPLTTRGDRVLDVIASAGGYRSPVHETFVSLTRDHHTVRVAMQTLLDSPRENIYVRAGDSITVERTPRTFTVMGAAKENAVINFDARGITLEQAISKGGGLIDDRSDPSGVFLLRYEPVSVARQLSSVPPPLLLQREVPVAYRLNLREPSSMFIARKFAVRDKDIVMVTDAPLTEVMKVAQTFSTMAAPFVQAGTLAIAAGRISR